MRVRRIHEHNEYMYTQSTATRSAGIVCPMTRVIRSTPGQDTSTYVLRRHRSEPGALRSPRAPRCTEPDVYTNSPSYYTSYRYNVGGYYLLLRWYCIPFVPPRTQPDHWYHLFVHVCTYRVRKSVPSDHRFERPAVYLLMYCQLWLLTPYFFVPPLA